MAERQWRDWVFIPKGQLNEMNLKIMNRGRDENQEEYESVCALYLSLILIAKNNQYLLESICSSLFLSSHAHRE